MKSIVVLASWLAVAPLLNAAETPGVIVSYAPDAATTSHQAALFVHSLQGELDKHEGLRVVTARPEKHEDASVCAEEKTCLAKLAAALGADEVLLARTTRVDGGMVMSLKRLRITSGEIAQAVTRRLRGHDGEAYLLALGDAVSELYPENALEPGGLEGVPSELVSRWSPPPLPTAVFWTGAALTGVGLAAIIASGLKTRSAQDAYDDYAKQGRTRVIEGVELQRRANAAETWTTRTNIALGVTGGLALVSAITFFFVDWDTELDVLVDTQGATMRGSF